MQTWLRNGCDGWPDYFSALYTYIIVDYIPASEWSRVIICQVKGQPAWSKVNADMYLACQMFD